MAQQDATDATGAESHPAVAERRRWPRLVLVVVLTLAALVQPTIALAARWDVRADLIAHLRGPALILTLAALVAAGRRYRWVAIGLGLLAAVQISPVVKFYLGNPAPPPSSGPQLRIMMANLYVNNVEPERLAEWIRRERPDVVGLVEVTSSLLARLEATGVRAEYPYRQELPMGTSGLALWFRSEPRSIEPPFYVSDHGNPVLAATVELGGRPLRLWLVHPPNPVFFPQSCNTDLAALGARLGREQGAPTVAVGDLNRSEASPYFRDFLAASGLRDSRLGFGVQPSWPSNFPAPLRIAIDHAFVSAEIAVADRRLGPQDGSDHLPLLLDVRPARAASRNSATQPRHASP